MYENGLHPPELRSIFERPLAERAELLTDLIGRLPIRDLCVTYPAIIENIFGSYSDPNPALRQGWTLDSLAQSGDMVTFRAVLDFLRPRGPLMNLAAKLTNEGSIKFNFPVARLPHGFRTQLRYGELSLFFAERLGTQGPLDVNPSVNLCLDAFELFIFNLVAYAVCPERPGLLASPAYNDLMRNNPLLHRTPGYIDPPMFQTIPPTVVQTTAVVKEEYKDCLYVFLIDGYLEFFLTGEKDPGPAATGGFQPSRTPITARSAAPHLNSTPVRYWSPLIKLSALSDNASNGSASASPSATSLNAQSKVDFAGTRRGQVMLAAVTHFWLALPPQYPGPACVVNVLAAAKRFDAGAEVNATKLNYSLITRADTTVLVMPSVDLITLTRIIVKHVHHFLSCLPDGASKQVDAVRKYTLDTLRTALYPFLRQTFQRWPLDGSFRMALELWLSYIQPWRYAPGAKIEGKNRPGELREEWDGFVASNYPFYSVFLQAALWRLMRMEFNSPRMAICLFRTSKVFATERLSTLLRALDSEVSQAVNYNKGSSMAHSQYTVVGHRSTFHTGPGMLGSSFLGRSFGSPMRATTSKMSAHGAKAVACLVDLEGTDGHIELLFTRETNEMVLEVMRNVRRAQQNLELEIKARNAMEDVPRHNVIQETCTTVGSKVRRKLDALAAKLIWLFGDTAAQHAEATLNGADEVAPADRVKLLQSFDKAMDYLQGIFDIEPPPKLEVPDIPYETLEETRRNGSPLTASGLRSRKSRLMSVDADETGMIRLPDIPEGHPDRGIAQSSEIPWVVLMLLDLSDWINDIFRDQICQCYFDSGLKGRLARPFLRPPCQYYECEKLGLGTVQRTLKSVPPRVCLRPFANKIVVAIFTFLICAMIFSVVPLNGVQLVAYLIVVCLFRSVFGAMCEVISGSRPREVMVQLPHEGRPRLNGGFRPGSGEPRAN